MSIKNIEDLKMVVNSYLQGNINKTPWLNSNSEDLRNMEDIRTLLKYNVIPIEGHRGTKERNDDTNKYNNYIILFVPLKLKKAFKWFKHDYSTTSLFHSNQTIIYNTKTSHDCIIKEYKDNKELRSIFNNDYYYTSNEFSKEFIDLLRNEYVLVKIFGSEDSTVIEHIKSLLDEW